jgi:hypothetical protein
MGGSRPRFSLGASYVWVKPRVGEGVQRGDAVRGVSRWRLRRLNAQGRIGPVGHQWTEAQLQRLDAKMKPSETPRGVTVTATGRGWFTVSDGETEKRVRGEEAAEAAAAEMRNGVSIAGETGGE